MGKTASLASLGSIADTSLGFRNRIINGDMRIDQRNAGASVSINGNFPVDRWSIGKDGGTVAASRSTVAPSGFTNSLLFSVTTGYTPTSAQQNNIRQFIEGFNVADLGWGTASAQAVTMSFWVRSSLTGTFSGSLMNSAYDRSYVFTFSVAAANTWEYKTVTIAGDTSGTWLTDNSAGIRLFFDMGSGSNYNATAGSWGAGEKRNTSGAVQPITSTGATFYITGVQLEAGSVATPFERRDYGRELIMCQRYYTQINGTAGNPAIGLGTQVNTTTIAGFIPLPVTLRSTPTVVSFLGGVSVTDTFAYNTGMTISSSVLVANGVSLAGTISANGAQGRPILFVLNGAGTNFGVSAEL